MADFIFSMTGFGRGTATGKKFRFTVDLRSVNGRFLEIRAKLPRALAFLEPTVREILEKKLSRGVVDLSLAVQPLEADLSSLIDEPLALAYAKKATALAKEVDIPAGLSGLALLKLPGVLGTENPTLFENQPEIIPLVKEAVTEALQDLLEMRRQEGMRLVKALQRELAEIKSHGAWIQKHRQEVNESYKTRLQLRFQDWIGKSTLDENRMYQEIAYYLDRADVTEELDRLGSHWKQCELALTTAGTKSVGKRMEFLMQEMGREVNTIGSKSDQAEVSHHVVEMKLTLEKIREQVQNLE